MALITAGFGQIKPAEFFAAFQNGTSVRGYRLGDECFVPIDRLAGVGINATLRANVVDVKLGDRVVSVPYRTFAGSQSVPMKRTLEAFGAPPVWEKGRDRLVGYNQLVSVEVDSGQIRVVSALPVATPLPAATGSAVVLVGFKNPDKAVKSAKGYVIDPGSPWPSIAFNGKSLANRLPANAANVLVWSDQPLSDPTPTPPTRDPVKVDPKIEPRTDPPVEIKNPIEPVDNGAEKFLSSEFKITGDIEGPTSTLLSLDLGPRITRQPNLRDLDPFYAEIEVTGVTGTLPEDFEVPSKRIKRIEVDPMEYGCVIRIWMNEPLAVELWKSGETFKLQFLRPGLSGKLAGKVVVIDAGHGGKDSGAKFSDAMEKNLTLNVSKRLANEMSLAGAKVIMTRSTDEFIALGKRADIANDAGADLFISVHINSSAKVGMSGSISFYHGPNTVKELLARSIETEIAAVSQLPSLGAWSDKRIYPTKGFAVLRQTKMPGVLLELGFINHPKDRARMLTSDYQSKVAKAIVRGVKRFLGEASGSSVFPEGDLGSVPGGSGSLR
jgi:N-acetylmuramoyl-L-alanine amidase